MRRTSWSAGSASRRGDCPGWVHSLPRSSTGADCRSASGTAPMESFGRQPPVLGQSDAFPDATWWRAFGSTTLPTCSRCSFIPLCWGACPKRHLDGSATEVQARRIDMTTPFVDAMMPAGSRLHVVIPVSTRTADTSARTHGRRQRRSEPATTATLPICATTLGSCQALMRWPRAFGATLTRAHIGA